MMNDIILSIVFDIEFNLGSLIIFLSGVLFGLLIFGLLYLYSVLKTLKEKKYIIESNLANEIKETDIKEIINEYQEEYLSQRKSDNKELADNAMKDAIFGVVHTIATKFFPDSKRPLLELTIDESIMLMRYITNRVDNLLGYRGLKIIRKLKISYIMSLVDTSKKVNNTQVIQQAKKYKLTKIIKTGSMIINAVNPFFWMKKIATKITTALIIKKIVLMIISIAGEETYKIYSKQAFIEQDPSYIKMMEEIHQALDESISFEELNDDDLSKFVDDLPNDEQEIVLSIPHDKKKSWWKKKAKEKVLSK